MLGCVNWRYNAWYQMAMLLCDTREAMKIASALAPLGERVARSAG